MKLFHFALYLGFGVFLAHIGHEITTWQYWVALGFFVAVDISSHVKATTR